MSNSFASAILEWASKNGRDFSWRHEKDAFRLLLAEVLLQRSRAKTVDRVLSELLDRWGSPRELAAAPSSEVAAILRPLGLTSRTERIIELAKAVVERGAVPRRPLELRELPGVGYYAAHSTSAALGGDEAPLVDSVSARVFRRYYGAGEYEDMSELAARAYCDAPTGRWHELNWAVLDVAATVCRPQRPICAECPISKNCAWQKSHTRAMLGETPQGEGN